MATSISDSLFLAPLEPAEDADAALMARVAAGDREAFRCLFEAYAGRVKALALRLTRHHELADEVVQEVFMAAWERPGDFQPHRGSVRAWIMTIAHHRAVDRVRRERAHADRVTRVSTIATARDWTHDDVAVAIDRLEARERASDTRRAMSALPGPQREVIERMYFGGRSGSQVASDLGIPLGTVKSRALLGMRKMRASLAAHAPFVLEP